MAWTYIYDENAKTGDLKSLGVTQFSVNSETASDLNCYLSTPRWLDELNTGAATVDVPNKSVTFSGGRTFVAMGDEARPEIVAAVDAIASITGWTTQRSINFLKIMRAFIVVVMKSRGV